ncbi:MAG: hypothetical protein IKA69_05960, partial [Kiritimatiellae bacterium]|nr:hypothetical protein [Kiritimatiellia bacterium]
IDCPDPESEAEDWDGDGLDESDETWNELFYGTDPLVWDTDGDGLPDGYEAWAGLDPVNEYDIRLTRTYTDTNDVEQTYTYLASAAKDAVEGDVMAYAMIKRRALVVADAVDGESITLVVDPSDKADYRVGGKLKAGGVTKFVTAVPYATLPADDWNDLTEKEYYALSTNIYEAMDNDFVVDVIDEFEIMLMHWQVYDTFGFESGVATPGDAEERADEQVHTRPMYGIDKYLVSALLGVEDEMNPDRRWGQSLTCLKPGVSDYDGDGIPDGWELYMMFPGAKAGRYEPAMNPWKAYDGYKLDAGKMVWDKLDYYDRNGDAQTAGAADWTPADWYNGGANAASPYTANDGNTFYADIDDKTARQWNIESVTNQLADVDNDGLSNMDEYLSARDTLVPGAADLDVRNNFSNGTTLDYFRTNGVSGTGRRYLGEIATDHDFMEDWYEDFYNTDFASRNRYDAYNDREEDGWSNWSEARAGTNPELFGTLSLVRYDLTEDNVVAEYPIPTIGVTLTYQTMDTFDSSIVLKAWHGDTAAGTPDAVWNVSGAAGGSTISKRFLGLNPNRKIDFNIGPGDIAEHHIKIRWYDPDYYIETINYETNGTIKSIVYTVYDIDSSRWSTPPYFGDDVLDQSNGKYTAALPGGWVNYKTGDISIDFSDPAYRNTDYTYHERVDNNQKIIHHWNLTRSFFNVEYMSRIVSSGNRKTFSLSKPMEADANSKGRLVEGRTIFIAFADVNGNGVLDPGEPFGYQKGVEVGWDKVADLRIELTDEAPALPRVALGAVSSNAWLSIRRQVVNDSVRSGLEKVVWTGRAPSSGSLTEADILLEAGGYVFDGSLTNDAAKAGLGQVYSACYGLYADGDLIAAFTNVFDLARDVPVPVSPSDKNGYLVRTARPTFVFNGDRSKYTAFAIQIADAAGDVVWASTTNVFPAATASGSEYVAPVYIGQGQLLADKTNYFWRVAQFNGKFPTAEDDADWSDWTPFKTAVDSTDGDTGYGKLSAEIRYYGAATSALTNVVVGVYETADFTGEPIAKVTLLGNGTVQDLARIPDAGKGFMNIETNVVFDGVLAGPRYVMAYIDVNGNGHRDRYEPWGYYNNVGTDTKALYTPMSLAVGVAKADAPSCIVFIEDTDVNDNGIPDSAEDTSSWTDPLPASADLTDADGDGLTAFDEINLYGTNPYCADTDGDGMDDGWEVANGLNPRVADSDVVGANDVMAYAEVTAQIAVSNDTVYAVMTVVDGYGKIVATNLYDTFTLDDGRIAVGRKSDAVVVPGQFYATVSTNVVLIHSAVYDWFGFDPTTANPRATEAEDEGGEDGNGLGRNTVPFTAYWKFVTEKRYLMELFGVDWSLKTAAIDSNANGLPDGWELYVAFATKTVDPNTNTGFPLAGDILVDAIANFNEGVDESDPWNRYYFYEQLGSTNGVVRYTNAEARKYDLANGDLTNDEDFDGLSNYSEFLASKLTPAIELDVTNPVTDGVTPDYFRKAGDDYMGLLFNGGEFIESELRRVMGIATQTGAGTQDYKDTGWDAWATARYSIYNMDQTVDISGVVSDELMLLIRYWNVIRPGEFTGTTVKEALDFFHEVWEGVIRLIDSEGNILIDGKDASVSGPGTIHQADAAQTTTQVVAFFGGQTKMEEVIARNKKDIAADKIVKPEPEVKLLLKYAGNGSHNVVIEAYQLNPAYPEYGEQMTAQWTTPVTFSAGIAQTVLATTPASGALLQGPARFVAYIDQDGSNSLSAGDIFGETSCEVGYLGCNLEIALGEANPALPALRLLDGTNAVNTIALVRTAINGKPLYNSAKGVFIVQFPNNAARETLYPDEYDNGSYIGIDDKLSSLVEDNKGDPITNGIESVTYEVLRLTPYEIAGLSITNLNHYILVETNGESSVTSNFVNQSVNEEITIKYSLIRDVAKSIACAGSTADDLTFTFTVPTDTANTKFWLKTVSGGETNILGGTKGFILNDIRDGVVVLDKAWFKKNNVAIPTGLVKFGVVLGNDRYGRPGDDSPDWDCAMAEVVINEGASFDGKIAVVAKHPTATLDSKLTIAAYESADLANPVAFTNNVAPDAAVELTGLRPDASYYIAAWYVNDENDGRGSDRNGNKYRMPYDTWGYHCNLDVTNTTQIAHSMAFDPVAVIAATNASEVTIYLQDTDWNDNNIVDREEDFRAINGDYDRSVDPKYGFDIAGIDEVELFSDAGENDVFAYAEVPFYCVMANVGGAEMWFAVTNLDEETVSDKIVPGIPVGALLKDLITLKATYFYDFGKTKPTRLALGTNIVWTGEEKVVKAVESKSLILVHGQVYDYFKFNPNTANGRIAKSGWVNTRSFTSADKSYVTNYLANVLGETDVSGKALPIDYPDVDEVVNGRGDGILDGWELYVKHSPWDFTDRTFDADEDGVDQLHEYDGGFEPTDPWDAYSVYNNFFENGLLLPGTPKFTDAEARRFGIAEADVDKDDDNDLLTNLQEIQAYYYDRTGLDDIDPEKAWSDGATPDYFRAAGSDYLGLLFNGGEFIEPDVRKAMGITTFARVGTRDYDGKGWDAWSTARYSILNQEQTLNVDGVVSDELMLLIRYWNVIRPGEFTGTTVGEAVNFFHEVWNGVIRLIDRDGNILIETTKDHEISGPGTIHNADAAQTTTQIVAFFGGQAKMEEAIAKNKKDITADEIVTPEPTVDLTVKYAGNGSYNLVLEAYQRSLAYPEYGEQLTAQWTLPVKFDAGVAIVNDIRTPGLGSLKQGPARFVAYIDQDGDNKLSAGDIYGTTDVEVGYLGAKLTIRMGGEKDYAYPLVRVQATNDCSIVALVRSKINDEPLYSQVAGVYYCYLPNNAAREAIYPIEFFTEEHTGLDKDLALDFSGELEQIESVTYEILHLDLAGLNDVNVTNLNHYLWIEEVETDEGVSNVVHFVQQSLNEEITFRYSNTRDKANVWGVADAVEGNVTVSFTVPNGGFANTRFWLKVNDAVYGGEYGNGFLIPPVAGNVVVLDQDWFDHEGEDVVFGVGENKVQVLLGNDKFGGDAAVDEWSEEASFSVNTAPDRKGKMAVEVKHPFAGFSGGVTIALYETADLVNPVAVTNDVASDSAVVIGGLRPGAKYYVAAWYVKEPEDGRPNADTRMPWDSWGYYCNLTRTNALQVASSYGFDPVAIAAGDTLVPTNAVWLQDTDFNDNGNADRDDDFLDIPAFYDRELEVAYYFDIAGAEERHTSGGGGSTATHWAMAYAVVPYATVATTNEHGATVWYAVVVDPADPSSSNVTSVGIAVGTQLSELKLASTYYYGKELALGTNVSFAADSEWKVTESRVQDVVLVHAQVLDRFGFDPATANSAIATGERVNSKEFTKRDKSRYLADYLENALGVTNAAAYVLNTSVDDSDPVYGGMGDGIADGWELYMMFKPDGVRDGVVGTVADLTNELVRLSPWNYGDREDDLDHEGLSNLLEYDGGHFPTNPYDVDTDTDNVTDLYAWRYMLKGDEGDQDYDGDRLSNYAEYLISEVFKFHTLDPRNPKTDLACVDYFRKVGNLYLGELFTDHDQVSDVWEAQYEGRDPITGDIWANRYVYDPEKDGDGDGWSNYAESRAGTSPEVADSIGIDQMTLAEHPVPVIEATVAYNGYDPIYGSIVFRAWNQKFDPKMMHAPDAIWTVPSSVSTGSAGNGTTTDSGAQVLEASKYVGLKPAGRVVYSLGPGSVTPGSVKIFFRDPAFRRAVVRDKTEIYVSDAGVSQASWYALVQDKNGELVTSITNQTAVAVGSIDYTTGKVEIDFGSAALSGSVYAQMINATSGNEKIDSDITHSLQYFNCEKLNLDASYVKLEWNRTRVGTNVGGVYYLGDADPATGESSGGSSGGNPFSSGGNSTSFTSMSKGYVREGLNSFVVYADQDGDGDYTPGEPFGFVRDVDVGWQGAKFSVELSETSPIFARVNVRTEENDRVNLYGVYSDTMFITNIMDLATAQSVDEASMTDGGRYIHVRIDRYAVNGVQLGVGAGQLNIDDRVLVDKYIDTNVRCVFHEGDFLDPSEFDIDWSTFEEISESPEIAEKLGDNPDITSVAYRIVVDNALVVSPATNNLSLACVFTRRFDADDGVSRQIPTDLEDVVCHGARPTFSWSMGSKNTYTAFQLQILDGGSVVYDSGVQLAPCRSPDGKYTWTAPISVGDQMPSGQILSTTGNYTWRVAMYNAKYKPHPFVDAFSQKASFRTDVDAQQDTDDDGFNAINVCVKYTGPVDVLAFCDDASVKGKVRLQAFTTADFSGKVRFQEAGSTDTKIVSVPASQTIVTGKDEIADASHTMANAKLIGLPKGTYYIRAYIDSNGNFEKDEWESWGQATVPVTVGPGQPAPVVGLYIEDADTDEDWVPDAYEYVKRGGLDKNDGEAKISGEFLMSAKLYEAVAADTLEAGVSTYLSGAALTAFQYADAIGTLLDVESSGEKTTIDAIREAVEKKVKPGTVKITSIAFDPVGQKVVLAVDAEVADTVAGKLLSNIYVFDSAAEAKVTVNVYRKDSLVQAEWVLVHTESDVAVGVHSQYVEVDLPDGDYTSGFYRVDIVQ